MKVIVQVLGNRAAKRIILATITLVALLIVWVVSAKPVPAQGLHLSYPPRVHQTTSDRVFFIGTAPPATPVTINGQTIQRTELGHFAPSLPLRLGENTFQLKHGSQEITVKVVRQPSSPPPPTQLGFVSLTPQQNIQIKPNEMVCFEAIGTPKAEVTVSLGGKTIPLSPEANFSLPPNSGLLVGINQPVLPSAGKYRGCASFSQIGNLGRPAFTIASQKESQTSQAKVTQSSEGTVEVVGNNRQLAIVTTDNAITRTGASSDFSRLTPLPQGVQALVTGKNGSWWRLDYGAWISANDVQIKSTNQVPKSIVRSLQVVSAQPWTEVQIPLQVPLPFAIQQDGDRLHLTLYNATAQTDTIKQPDSTDRALKAITWQQTTPQTIVYTIRTKTEQQWGYKINYRGTTLVLSVKHPPRSSQVFSIVLDAGHGGPDDPGAVSPTGYPEKDATLVITKLVAEEFRKRGAKVIMTRTRDVDMDLAPRTAIINQTEPTIALSLHYNALPDNGNAEKVQGIGTFWYHGQSQRAGAFIHKYLVTNLRRADYGIYWGNLAMVRPTVAPTLLLELGFMINPKEFAWIIDPKAQRQTAQVLANAVYEWLRVSVSQ